MGKGQTTNREGKGSQQRGAVWGRGQEKRRQRRRCPPGEETGGPSGSSEAIRGGQGEDAYPGRSLLRVASGLLPNPLGLGTNCEQTDGLPLHLFLATRASHLITSSDSLTLLDHHESYNQAFQGHPHPSSLLAAVFTAATVQLEYTKETQF